MSHYVADQTFERLSAEEVPAGTYEGCTFHHCDFSEQNLSDRQFVDCVFEECQWVNTRMIETAFTDTLCRNCTFIGIAFDRCKTMLFSLDMENCQVKLSGFPSMNLSGRQFTGTVFTEVDFLQTDLSGADFSDCQFPRTHFDDCNLEKANFSHTEQLQLNPDKNKMKGARFTPDALPALLTKYQLKIERP